MKRLTQQGFTFIEIIVFIIVSGLLMSTILFATITVARSTPALQQQRAAQQTARKCMEWYLQQRRLNGFTSLTCPSSPTATACSAPTGYAVNTSIACTTWNGDTSYKTITVTVTGRANATLSTQIGDY